MSTEKDSTEHYIKPFTEYSGFLRTNGGRDCYFFPKTPFKFFDPRSETWMKKQYYKKYKAFVPEEAKNHLPLVK